MPLLPRGSIEPFLHGISSYPATLPVSYSEADLRRPCSLHVDIGLAFISILQVGSRPKNPTHLDLVEEDESS